MLAAAALCCGGVICFVLLYKVAQFVLNCLKVKQRYKESSLPGPVSPGGLLGHVPLLLSHKGPWALLKWVNDYGPIFKFAVAPYGVGVVLSDPDTIARVTRKTGPGPYAPKPQELYGQMNAFGGPNILSSGDNPYWRAVRQAAAPCFSMSNMKQVVPLVLDLTRCAADRMAQHASFDVTDAAKRITSDVMGHLLFDEDLRATHWEPSEYLNAFNTVIKAQGTTMSDPFYMYRLWNPEVRFARRCLSWHNNMMMDKVKRLREQPPAPHTIAAHILSAIDPATGKPINNVQARAEISIFLAAGFETTSTAITWCLALLASHPDIQDQVHAELQEAGLAAKDRGGGSPGRPFEASDLGTLPLLSAIIKETLRVCAPAPFGGFRQIVQEEGAELCGHHVPKGTYLLIPGFPVHMAQHNYGADALHFKPQRWLSTAAELDPDSTGSISTEPAGPGAKESGLKEAGSHAGKAASRQQPTSGLIAAPPEHIAFLTGPRDCIGQNLAKLELQVVLATLLSRFRFSPGPELEQELKLAAATGQPPMSAVHALAGAFITLQPLSAHMMLKISSRA